MAGGQVGGNYQIGNVVLGLEGIYDWADIKNTQVGALGAGTLTLVTKNDYIATVAGRLGYAFDRLLIYGKGGAAFTRDRADANLTGPLPGAASGSFNRTGWLAGAGVEWAFWGNWSVKAEYDYMGFGAINEVITNATGSLKASPATVKLNVQTGIVGVNYKFGFKFQIADAVITREKRVIQYSRAFTFIAAALECSVARSSPGDDG